MIISNKEYETIINNLVDDGLNYCNSCDTYFVVRNTDDGLLNGRVCPCCGVCGDDHIEVVESEKYRMSRYGIETIAESVYQSSVCPFMRERCCANGNEDCQKCVKEWFADHDKQIRNEAIEEFAEWLVDKGVLGNRCICDGEITDYGKIYAKEFKQMKERD